MELKNLNDVSIYIVPLIDDNITQEDLTEESGFVNAFTTDKNRPSLEDKVFLLYDSKVNTVNSMNTHRKLSNLDTLHNTIYITIDKKHYTVYCINRIKYKKDIHNLISSGKTYSLDASLEINRFWNNVPVPELSMRLFYDFYRFGESISATLPEEDYYSYKDFGESS